MQSTRQLARKRNLLLAFDAFGTLFYPKQPIPKQYGHFAELYGIQCMSNESGMQEAFKKAYKDEASKNPNYGKATRLGAERWWANVISKTFQPFLKPDQEVPQGLVNDLLRRFSTSDGYAMYSDVLPFFQMLQSRETRASNSPPWKWDKTVVGVITNSDSRVPGILESFGLKIGPRRVGSGDERSQQTSKDNDISFVVLSYDVGHEKPDLRMFDAAIQMLKETLAEDSKGAAITSIDDFEKLYVGDSLEKDYFGASEAGWNAVWLDRRHQDDNLKDSPIERTQLKSKEGGGKEVARQVYAIRDLRALSGWSPELEFRE